MKKLIALALVLVMVLSITACAKKTDKTWDISISSPTNTTDTIGTNANALAEGLNAATNGVVTAHFFGGSTLGSQRDAFNALTTGEIEMIVDGSVPVDLYAPEYGFLVAPYLLRSMDHLNNVIASPIWEGFEKKLEESGVMILGVILRGSRQTISTQPIDWNSTSSIIIRMPDVATYVAAWTAAGANTQVMGAGDLYASLQNGVVNAAEGPWAQHVSLSMSDVCKYGYETNHMHEFYAVYASKVWFDSLPAETQKQVRDAVAKMCEETTAQNAAENEGFRKQLEEAGVVIESVDVTKLFEAAETEWNKKFESGEWTSSMEEILSYNK